ncbi:hypothetical protein DFH06DRAFT_1345600 [Mycena polygramma]|nr:hypothetical protein DFH06DRAFT_1345600 [Mycena polygramma]
MDTATTLPHALISRVVATLGILDNVLGNKQLPPEAFPDFLPRVCTWFKFLDTYSDSHPDIKGCYFDICCLFVRIVYRLQREYYTTTNVFDNTPGLRTLLVRAWARILTTDDSMANPIFIQVSQMMLDLEPEHPANFQELLLGVRGGVLELATLITSHLSS